MILREIPTAIEKCIEECRRSSVVKSMSDYTGVLRLLAQELLQQDASEDELIKGIKAKQKVLEKRSTRLAREHGQYTPIERGEKRHAERHYSETEESDPVVRMMDFYPDEEDEEMKN